jgi:hypothetical protein
MQLRQRARAGVALLLLGPALSRAFAQRAKEQPPVITAFAINGGSDTVSASAGTISLAHTVVGARPSEYRVSHRADFAGSSWLAYTSSLVIRDWYDGTGVSCDRGQPSHRVTLYMQVRATVGEEVRIVDGQRQLVPARVESNVLRATICARVSTSGSSGAAPAIQPLDGPGASMIVDRRGSRADPRPSSPASASPR